MIDATLLNWTLNQILVLVMIMIRVGPLLFLMPITGSRNVPSQVKILLTAATAIVLLPVVPVQAGQLPSTFSGFLLFVASEVCFGAILAVFTRLIFDAVQVAGQMVGIQMGMGMAGVLDPQFGTQVSLIGQFWNLLAVLIFLAVDGHHLYIRTLQESFTWVAPGSLHISHATFEGLMQGTSRMFIMSIKIMAPASAAVFFSHIAMGIIAKTVPQIPILIVGMPINIAVGFIFVGLSLAYFLPLMIGQFEMLGRILPRLAQGLGG
jgi:flagellar biosynthesis protein FliR